LWAPADQDANDLAEMTVTAPFRTGRIDNLELIGMASDKDCWKQQHRVHLARLRTGQHPTLVTLACSNPTGCAR